MVRVMALSDGYLMFTIDPKTGKYIEYSSVLLGFFGKAKEIISSFALVDTPN